MFEGHNDTARIHYGVWGHSSNPIGPTSTTASKPEESCYVIRVLSDNKGEFMKMGSGFAKGAAHGGSSKRLKRSFGDPVVDLRRHINSDICEDEFRHLEQSSEYAEMQMSKKEAQKKENQSKNRYCTVLPYDTTRVKLNATGDESDYINASLVQGEDASFIASQGPLASTFNDFWRMTWENNVNIIVMLTLEKEGEKVKCDRYWPDTKQATNYGSIEVTLQEEAPVPDKMLLKRSYKLRHLQNTNESPKEVVQLHFTGWPDHGVPKDPDVLNDLVKQVDGLRDHYNSNAPVVVHCSAGIGRTGAFIANHIIATKMKKHFETKSGEPFKYDIYNTVVKLRTQRTGMVQQPEQYKLIYESVLCESERLTTA